jgi:tripartite-type tricarboxylate transporter receptor subunit TctC
LLVPWSAGGATDLSMRVLAEVASQHLGQRVIVENKPGAGGILAMPALTQAAPDGYTVAQMPQTVFRAPWVQKVMWDPVRDTAAILQISTVTFGLVVPAASPWQSVAQLLAWARQHPGELTVATNGVGTTPHLLMEEWFGRLGLQYIHVPYKGVSEQMLAVSSSQVMLGVGANGISAYVEAGKARMLATTASRRSLRRPQVPTMRELGHEIVASSAYGLAAPRGVPSDVVQVLHDAFKQALFDARHVAELARYDQETAYLDSASYRRSMLGQFQSEQAIVKRLGLQG